MTQLSNLLKEILTCTTCGQCRAACPVFESVGWEAANARGKVLIAYGLLRNELNIDVAVVKRLYQCTFCMHCEEKCSSGVPVTDIVNATRQETCKKGFLPEMHKKIITNLQLQNNPFGEPPEKRAEFLPSDAKLNLSRKPLVFVGCTALYQDMGIVGGIFKLLNKMNVDYFTLGLNEPCCGYVSYLIGSDKFNEFAANCYNKILNTGATSLVTTCAGCQKTFKTLYPKQLGLRFDIEVLHIVEFLSEILKQKKVRFSSYPEKVVYHDPCDIGRGLKIFEQPRFIINEIPDVNLVEFNANRRNATCCGGGGGLKGFDTKLSLKLAHNRVSECASLGATTIVSACPACKSNLKLAVADMKKSETTSLKVLDIVELLARCVS